MSIKTRYRLAKKNLTHQLSQLTLYIIRYQYCLFTYRMLAAIEWWKHGGLNGPRSLP